MHIYHNLFNHWIFKNFTYYKQCCNVYMCMCMCVEGEVFAYLHISAEQISRSGMLNQSILLLQDVLQKDCSDVKFFKADSQPFFSLFPGYIGLLLCEGTQDPVNCGNI